MLGFDADHLLTHHQQRRVFGVRLFPGASDFLMGKETVLPDHLRCPQRHVNASQKIAEFWTARWLSMRLDHAPALEALQSVMGGNCQITFR